MDKGKEIWLQLQCFFLENKKCLAFSVGVGLLITLCVSFATRAYANWIQTGIADSVVRFHVLANSDTMEDQSLKALVRDAVLKEMKTDLANCANKEQSLAVLEKNMDRIKQLAKQVIEENGYDYAVAVYLSTDPFPYKKYGDTVFPAGMYDALRIEIGNAEGKNWWCVMFPPLCYVDAGCEELSLESKNKLKNILTEEEYAVVVESQTSQNMTPQVKWKVVEWWQEKQMDEDSYVTNRG